MMTLGADEAVTSRKVVAEQERGRVRQSRGAALDCRPIYRRMVLSSTGLCAVGMAAAPQRVQN